MSPLHILQPHHVVRLTGVSIADQASSEISRPRLREDWRRAQEPVSNGLLYAELCEQIPEWSALAEAEMDHPIAYDFLEYAVFEPGTPFTTLAVSPVLPASVSTPLGLFNVSFRFVKENTTKTPGALMFNLFEIDGPPAMEQGFLMAWPPRGMFKIQEDSVFATVLHQRMQRIDRIAAFNRAEVSSAADYASGIARFEHAFPRKDRKGSAGEGADRKPPIRSHLGLFRVAESVQGRTTQVDQTMNAVRLHGYGGPEVLVQEQVPVPKPGPGQIRIRVKGSSINPLDTRMRSGEVRNIYPAWFPDTVGYSISGVVDAVGAQVMSRKVGEEVYGINNPIMRHGYAEYVIGPESFYFPKPPAMDFNTAAAAPSIFATAHGALFGRAQLKAGQRVLIHGGSGVVGSCAVQLAKQAGAYVYATASTRNVGFVRDLGADVAIDYKTQRFEELATDLDMVLDTVGGETRQRSWPLLKKGGVLASLQPPDPDQDVAKSYSVQGFMVHGHPSIGEIMPEMTRKLIEGELRFPDVATVFPLHQAAEAHALFEKQAPKGRIILQC